MDMIKPKRLRPGDRIAVVSLSWGALGEPNFIHRYEIAKKRLWEEFGLETVCMPHALCGSAFLSRHPRLRAKDLMDAFLDPNISAVFCAIGGGDTIRLLPYIDFDVLRENPKIFMGYSDSTINHFMMYHAGLVSFYGPSILAEFGEYVELFSYTKDAVRRALFEDTAGWSIPSSPEWSDDFVLWDEKNIHIKKSLKPDLHGYEVLQGSGCAEGHLFGGCIDVFSMAANTCLWPSCKQLEGAILFLETSEEKPSPSIVRYTLRNLAAQGILSSLHGILFGKPQGEVYYEEYKEALLQVVSEEEGLHDLPILYNINIGHAAPIGVLPYGVRARIDCEEKALILLESATVEP